MEAKDVPFSELLANVVDNRGKTCPTSEAGIPLIATNCIRNDLLYPAYDKVRYVSQETFRTWFRSHPRPGDFIFVTKGTPGRVCLTPDPVNFCIAQDMVAVRANQAKVDPMYLFALLRSDRVQKQIEQLHVGTLIPHFKKGDFDKLLLPIPDRSLQNAIGNIYFQLSRKVELNRCMNETLEAIARAIFQSWFLDSAPSHQVSNVGDEFTLTMGQSPPGVTYNEIAEGLPFFQGRTDFGFRFPEARVYCTDPTRLAEPGDTLVSVRAPVGDINMAKKRCCIGRGVAALRHKSGSRSYTYYSAQGLKQQLESFEAEGTVFGSIGKDQFKALKVFAPPEKAIQEFEEIAKSIDDSIESNEEQSSILCALRDALLPKLISGAIRLKDVEKIVEARA